MNAGATAVTLIIDIGEAPDEGAGYPVALVEVDPAGIRSRIAGSTISETDLVAAEEIRDKVRKGASADIETFGKEMLTLLGDAGRKWTERHQHHRKAGNPARSLVSIVPQRIRLLPWEVVMLDGEFPSRNSASPLRRAASAKHHPHDPEVLPLRVLVILGGGPKGRDAAMAEELAALRKMFRAEREKIDAEVLLHPTRDLIRTTYEHLRPHVVHFIGHGVVGSNGPELQIWRDEKWRPWLMSDIDADLGNGHRPRFVFLNACRSGDSGEPAAYDLGQLFIEKLGACGTITMLGDVDGAAAAAFATAFYQQLIAFVAFDRAAAHARNVMSGYYRTQWPLPVLQVACDPSIALPNSYAVDSQILVDIKEQFTDLKSFVDRRDDRRKLASSLVMADVPPQEPKRLVVLHGSEGVGKTALVRWVVRHFSLHGKDIRYVDLHDGDSKGFDKVLEVIRNDAVSPAHGPLPGASFERFDAVLGAFRSGNAQTENVVEELFDAFAQGLTELTAKRPSTLVIDHLRNDAVKGAVLAEDLENYIWPFFLKRVAVGAIPNLIVVVVLAGMQTENTVFERLKSVGEPWQLMEWQGPEFPEIAAEFFADDADSFAQTIILAFAEKTKEKSSWLPRFLYTVRDYIRTGRNA